MRTLVPGYPAVKNKLAGVKAGRACMSDLFGGPARVLAGRAAGLDLFVLDAPHLYDRPGNPYLGAGRAATGPTTRFASPRWRASAPTSACGAIAGFAPRRRPCA